MWIHGLFTLQPVAQCAEYISVLNILFIYLTMKLFFSFYYESTMIHLLLFELSYFHGPSVDISSYTLRKTLMAFSLYCLL